MPEEALFFDPSKDRDPTFQAMTQVGLQVVSVESPESALNALKQKKFNIFVSEINVDPYPLSSFLTESHKLLKPHGTPHLVVTESRNLFHISLTETFRVRPILFKPVENTLLLAALRYHLITPKAGTLLCSNPNLSYFNRSFSVMGFSVQAFSRMSDFQGSDKDPGFIIYEEGFEGATPMQLIQRLAQSKKKIPLFFFLKKPDAALETILKKYGPYKIETPPYNWDQGEEALKKMILDNVPAPPSAKPAPVELKTPLKENDKEAALPNPMDETQTGRVSVNAFLQALPIKITNQNFRPPFALFLKMRGAFQRQKCLEFLNTPQLKEVILPLTEGYRTGNRLLRETLIDLLSEIKDKSVLDLFVLALKDPFPEIRQAALAGLQSFPISETAKYFQTALRDPDVKIRSYAGKLLENHTDWGILNDFFQAQQAGQDVVLKRSFLKYLESNAPKLDNPGILLPIFNSKDTVLKEGILDMLVTQKKKNITPFLKLAAATDERILHRLVMEGFQMNQDPEGIPILLKYVGGKDSTLAETAIQSILDSHASAKHLALFFSVMEKGGEALRDYCIQAVKNFKEEESRPVLQLALKIGSTGNKLAAIDAMLPWKNENLVSALAPLLEDPDRSVRAFVSKHVNDRVDKSCIEPLIRAFPRLKDEESKQFTASILARLVQVDEVTYWMKMLHSDSFSILTRILQESGVSLGKFTTEVLGKHLAENASFDIILKTLYDPNAEARAEAALVLGEQKNPAAVPHLARFLDDENWYVRKVVIETLGKMNAKETANLLLKKVTDENPSVRFAAAVTLETFNLKFKEALFPLIFKETTEKVCEQLVRLLSPANDMKAAEFHLTRLSSASISIRVQAAAEILSLWGDGDAKLLTSWLSSDKWPLRLTALFHFSKTTPALVLENSARYYTDPSEEVRKFIFTFLVEQQKENPGPVLSRFVADESADIRKMLFSECEKTAFPEKLDLLFDAFKNEKNEVLQSHLIDLLALENDPRIPNILSHRYTELPDVLQKKVDAISEKYLNEK